MSIKGNATMNKAQNLAADISQAKGNHGHLSLSLDKVVAARLHTDEREIWLEENQQGIDAINRFVEEYGHFADFQRAF